MRMVRLPRAETNRRNLKIKISQTSVTIDRDASDRQGKDSQESSP